MTESDIFALVLRSIPEFPNNLFSLDCGKSSPITYTRSHQKSRDSRWGVFLIGIPDQLKT